MMSIFFDNEYGYIQQEKNIGIVQAAAANYANEVSKRNREAKERYERYCAPQGDVLDVEMREIFEPERIDAP